MCLADGREGAREGILALKSLVKIQSFDHTKVQGSLENIIQLCAQKENLFDEQMV